MKSNLRARIARAFQSRQSKQQQLHKAVVSEEVLRQRGLVKNQLYPFLINNSKSVEDAKNLCTSLAIVIKQAWENKRRDYIVKSLALDTLMSNQITPEENKKWDMFMGLIENEKINVATDLLDGMASAVDSFIKEENCTKPLSSLKVTFL